MHTRTHSNIEKLWASLALYFRHIIIMIFVLIVFLAASFAINAVFSFVCYRNVSCELFWSACQMGKSTRVQMKPVCLNRLFSCYLDDVGKVFQYEKALNHTEKLIPNQLNYYQLLKHNRSKYEIL